MNNLISVINHYRISFSAAIFPLLAVLWLSNETPKIANKSTTLLLNIIENIFLHLNGNLS